MWREEQAKVEQSASTISAAFRSMRSNGGAAELLPTPASSIARSREFASSFDARRGGFGGAPKFPRPSELLFLLREHARTGAPAPRDMVLVTLRAMALGGMRDHLGGGFHRYSVDADWRVPHFEKMLYDQAQLVLAYAEAAQVTGDRFYADVALDTLDYVRRDLTSPGGGFFSAEDADSVPPEHATSLVLTRWRAPSTSGAMTRSRKCSAPMPTSFRARYGILPDGNAPADPQGEFTDKNLLYTARSLDDVAAIAGRSVDEVVTALRQARGRCSWRDGTRGLDRISTTRC